jgi:hypothetical protein
MFCCTVLPDTTDRYNAVHHWLYSCRRHSSSPSSTLESARAEDDLLNYRPSHILLI